jgi:eukaryotic-like serine/threonine-protein kinase
MIAAGTRLGPYAISASIGAGGMGEVYKATDTRLDRTVAIKVLPEHVASDPELKQRFEREAKTLAALSHPHICPIHDVGSQNGIDFLVMEYLEGETLEQRLKKGALSLDQALQIGIQITDALSAAHRAGIVHRDLKPGNIMLTKSGAKLLDFGLAKTAAPAVAGSLSMLPTTPPSLTAQGAILGTFQYMAPEQLEGHEADARTDIFAFGAVLYEMVTGRKAFEGRSQASLIAAILEREPAPLSSLQPMSPPALDRIVKKCLAKNPDVRWHTAHDLHDELRWVADQGSPASVRTTPLVTSQPAGRRRLATIGVTATLVGAVLAAGTVWYAIRATPSALVRMEITTAGGTGFRADGAERDLAITPDGSRLVYHGRDQLLVRALDQLTPIALTGLGEPHGPFVSPDGQWVGFFDGTALKKVAITGGPPVTVTAADGTNPRGATWGDDGTIVYATSSLATGLHRVAAAGGEPTVLTTPDRKRGEADHSWPEFLPGGEAVLFTITPATGGLDSAQIAVLDLRRKSQTVLVRSGSHARYVPTGHLVYAAGGTLRAVAFDLATRTVTGTPVPVIERVLTTPQGAVDAAVAATGTLIYAAGSIGGAQRSLVWVDRQGREAPVRAPVRSYLFPRLSPDGTRVAVRSEDQEDDLWVWDVQRATLTRRTFEPGLDSTPVWTPDGRGLIFSSGRTGAQNLYWQAADGTGAVTRLTVSDNQQLATGITPDGTRVIFSEATSDRQRDLRLLTLTPTVPTSPSSAVEHASAAEARPVTTLLETRFEERGGVVSPDGRWLAYESNSSGQFEIYVRPFPNISGGQWQVSLAGGVQALWERRGRELFFVAPDGALMAVRVTSDATTWRAGAPVKLLDGRYYTGGGGFFLRQYDVTVDGQRFLMVKEGEGGEAAALQNLTVVLNWFQELKRLVPRN